ncbi:MAG: glycosyltransferase [Candidatus Aenigmatarchaeota archaeon]
MTKAKPLISVIIPAYNEEEGIKGLLSDLERQTYKKFEVIVVDDKSTDNTIAVAKEFGAKVIVSGRHNLSYSRNLGIRNSEGAIIVNMDADYRVNKTFIEGIAESFDDPLVQGVKVREILVQDTLTEKIDYLRTFYKYGGYTIAIRVFRRGIFSDETLTCFGEDIAMNKKITGKIALCKKALIKHHRFHSFGEMARSWRKYPTGWQYYRKYEKPIAILKWFIPFFYPFASPFIAIHRLIKFRDPVALLIPVYDTVRTIAYIEGAVRMVLKR